MVGRDSAVHLTQQCLQVLRPMVSRRCPDAAPVLPQWPRERITRIVTISIVAGATSCPPNNLLITPERWSYRH
eukprot:5949868-Pyramimonas_sp.AAC.1